MRTIVLVLVLTMLSGCAQTRTSRKPVVDYTEVRTKPTVWQRVKGMRLLKKKEVIVTTPPVVVGASSDTVVTTVPSQIKSTVTVGDGPVGEAPLKETPLNETPLNEGPLDEPVK